MLNLADSILNKMDAIGVSSNFLAKLYGCSNGQMAMWPNGTKPLPNDVGMRIYKLVEKLEHLEAFARPLPLTFRDEAVIRNLLDKLDERSLTIVVEDLSSGMDSRQPRIELTPRASWLFVTA